MTGRPRSSTKTLSTVGATSARMWLDVRALGQRPHFDHCYGPGSGREHRHRRGRSRYRHRPGRCHPSREADLCSTRAAAAGGQHIPRCSASRPAPGSHHVDHRDRGCRSPVPRSSRPSPAKLAGRGGRSTRALVLFQRPHVGGLGRLVPLLQQLAGHDDALDLVGPLVDLRYLRVPHHPLDRVVLHVPVSAEQLNGVGRHLHRHV